MASVKIYEANPVVTKRITPDFSIKTSISAPANIAVINSTLPFRIKFSEAAGPNAVPPIPLQVIGFSNYIL